MGGKDLRPSPATAIAFVALLAALSGTAVALPGSNTVTSGDIRNGAVKSGDLKNNDVRGRDVRANTLKGSDIDEGSLGQVPSANAANTATTATRASVANRADSAAIAAGALNASNATNAASINGATIRTFRYSVSADAPSETVLELAGMRLQPNCDGGDLDVIAAPTETGALLSASEDPANSIEVVASLGSEVDLVPAQDDDQVGHTEWVTDDGAVLSLNWQSDNTANNAPCQFAGTAVGTG